MRPATDGNHQLRHAPIRVHPVVPRLVFHELRHSHKTWLIADAVPEIAQARRLGHALQDKIQAVYSHIAAEVEHRLINGLQDRWEKALANQTDHGFDTTWRR